MILVYGLYEPMNMNRLVDKTKLITRHPIISTALCAAFVMFPIYYLLVLLYNPQLHFLRNTAVNYIVIMITGISFALFANNILHSLNARLKALFRTLFASALFLYGAVLVTITYYCYTHYIFESIDLSYYHIAIWQLSQWKLPYIWDMPTTPIWQQHFEPVLFFFVPIYWVIRDAGFLVIIQAFSVISGAIPLYLTAKLVLRSRFMALASAYAYLAFGGLQVGYAYGFHPIVLFPSLFLWMYFWYVRKKPFFYILFVLLCLFVKEEVSFIMLFWGLYLIFVKRDVRLGIITSTMGALWYILCFQIIFPHFSPKIGFVYWYQYNQTYGKGVTGLFMFALKQPRQFLMSFITPAGKIDMFLCLFGAFAFLPFIYPPSLIIVFPSLMEKLLNSGLAALNGTHYTAAVTGVTVVATVEALRVIRNKPWASMSRGAIFLGTVIAYVAFFSNILYGCLTFAVFPLGNIVPPPKDSIAFLNQIISLIPAGASVGAQYVIAPHIAKPFGKIFPWPNFPIGPDYIIYDTQLAPELTSNEIINDNLHKLSANADYRLVINHLGIVVFKKIK